MLFYSVLSFREKKRVIVHKHLSHGALLEIVWTLIPALMLITIAIPSFRLLYIADEIIDAIITIKVIGHQ